MLSLFNRLSTLQKVLLISLSAIIFLSITYSIRDLISPFFIALIFSYLLNPIVDRLEFIFQKRILAVIALYIGITCALILFFNYFIPILIEEFNELSTKHQFYGNKIKEWTDIIIHRVEHDIPIIKQLNIVDTFKSNLQLKQTGIITNLAQKIPNFFISTFSTVSFLLLIPIILFFFLFQGPDMKIGFFKLIPNKYFELLIYLFYSMGNKIGNYLRGIFFETIVIGLLTTIMLLMLDVDYSVLLGVLAGIMNVIPYLGPLLGALPAILIFYLKVKTLNALLYIIIGFAIVQTIDNFLLKPLIYSQSVDLHPLSVLFFLILGGMIAGVWGLILAVPVAGILKVAISILLKEIQFRIQFNEKQLIQ